MTTGKQSLWGKVKSFFGAPESKKCTCVLEADGKYYYYRMEGGIPVKYSDTPYDTKAECQAANGC